MLREDATMLTTVGRLLVSHPYAVNIDHGSMGSVVANAPLPRARLVGGLDIRPLHVVNVGADCARCGVVRRARSRD